MLYAVAFDFLSWTTSRVPRDDDSEAGPFLHEPFHSVRPSSPKCCSSVRVLAFIFPINGMIHDFLLTSQDRRSGLLISLRVRVNDIETTQTAS